MATRTVEERRMSITASDTGGGGGVKILAPSGLMAARAVDVVDLGMVKSEFYGTTKPKITIHWLLDRLIPTGKWTHPLTGEVVDVPDELAGKPFMVSKRYTLSLHENATLRHDLMNWRGKDFTPEQLQGFDVESVIGAPAGLNILHQESGGKWWANVAGISSLPEGWDAPDTSDYVRFKDRDGYDENGVRIPDGHDEKPREGEPWPEDESRKPVPLSDPDDDLPF
jgi:hypothetical protein